jgi:hypothetical protein
MTNAQITVAFVISRSSVRIRLPAPAFARGKIKINMTRQMQSRCPSNGAIEHAETSEVPGIFCSQEA